MVQVSGSIPGSAAGIDRRFATTHWSVVLAAGEYPTPAAVEAIGRLYLSYSYPLYAYVRKRGYDLDAAQDLIQDFFARLLEKNLLSGIVREGGKFRSFLLSAINHRLADEWDKRQAQKRGGGASFLALDAAHSEERFHLETAGSLSAEQLFDRRWVSALVENTLAALREECMARGLERVFDRLSALLIGERDSATYVEIGEELGMTESAVKAAVHRLRLRYRELFREQVSLTVARPEEVEAEMQAIRGIMAG